MTQKKFTNRSYLDALEERILIFDGAMGTSLQELNLTVDDFGGESFFGCNDYLVITCPGAVEKVHRSFLDAGVDVIETNTFRSNRITLGEYHLKDRTIEINQTAASLARRLADEYSQPGYPRFVAGSMGPSGKLPSMNDPELSNITFDELVDVLREQAVGLIQGGVDLILIETSQDILEVRAAIQGIQAAFEQTGVFLPIQAQVTLDTTGRMLLGTDIAAALTILENLHIDIIGLNCSTGPEHMREPIRFLGENSPLPVSCIPNAGLPLNVDGKAVYPLEPEPFAEAMVEFIEKFHVSVVGGCCGTTPAHLKQLVKKVHGKKSLPRPILNLPSLASSVQSVPMQQEPAPFLIGERLNTQGSRIFKQLILEEKYEEILPIAEQQIQRGAHGLDICVALTERSNEVETIQKVIKTISQAVTVPVIIDTTELDVMETALKTAPGRCLINSTNLESGREKADRVFMLAKKYNAAVMVLTIDENGMAKTAQRKLEIAKRLFEIAVNEHGLRPQDLVFDALTFTLATGDPEYFNSAKETLEGIRKIKKEIPGSLTSLGVSNISFGFSPAARAVVNSVMLYHSVQAGLDMAIVNPAHITPYPEIPLLERELAEDLLFNRRNDALQRLIAHFEKVHTSEQQKDSQHEALTKMTPEERLHWRIVFRNKENIDTDIDEIIQRTSHRSKHEIAVEILNTVLLPAMKEVGDKFGNGELILPFVLQSAEVMKKSVSFLENYLEKKEGVSKGKMVLATVYGDVHDIGKNLVKTILSNNGYDVVDLGKQVPAETIITRAVEENADAIGLSALLVSTSKQMPLIINELDRRGLQIPVLIGGAAINEKFGRRILQTERGTLYTPGVFYCKDAFEGLHTMDSLQDRKKKDELLRQTIENARRELGIEISSKSAQIESTQSRIPPVDQTPVPPSWGSRVVKEMPLEIVFQHINKKELFRLSWGGKNTRGEKWKMLEAEFEQRLEKMRKENLKAPWLFPQGVYGYWAAQSDGNDLILYDPAQYQQGILKEIVRFNNPRQGKDEYLCLSDYFAPVNSGQIDTVALQVVTVGKQATQHIDDLNEHGQFSEAYFAHGLAVQVAEAAADYLHNHIRRELGIPAEQGKRYSWGFPAIPDVSEHQKVFTLLPAEIELGMSLTSAFQLVPEQSTAAIIVHHPMAKYYDIGESRIEQLLK